MKKLKLVPLVIAVVACLYFLGSYVYYNHIISEEQKITLLVMRVREAGEKRSAGGILAEVSENYRDRFSANRRELSEKVRYWVVNNLSNDVKVEMHDLRVEVEPEGKRATARLRVGGNKPVQDVLTALNESGEVVLFLAHEDGRWLITTVESAK